MSLVVDDETIKDNDDGDDNGICIDRCMHGSNGLSTILLKGDQSMSFP